MNVKNILNIPKILLSQKQSNKDNKMIQQTNYQNNNSLDKEKNNATKSIYINQQIDNINNKIKTQDEKLNKIESSLETIIKIFKSEPEIKRRSKSSDTKNVSNSSVNNKNNKSS